MLARRTGACVTASFTAWAVAQGKMDHSSATVPVANGAATLAPLQGNDSAPALELTTPSPGARRPRRPIERPAFE